MKLQDASSPLNRLRVRCAVCGTPVVGMFWWDDPCRQAIELHVFCHGKKDTMHFTHEAFMAGSLLEQIDGQEGVAFQKEALPPPPDQ